MKWSKAVLLFSIGFAGSYFIQKALTQQILTPEQALKAVKKRTKTSLNLDGTWIFQHTEDWKGNTVCQKVYRGGLTERNGNELLHYDFIVDAESGALLALTPQL